MRFLVRKGAGVWPLSCSLSATCTLSSLGHSVKLTSFLWEGTSAPTGLGLPYSGCGIYS